MQQVLEPNRLCPSPLYPMVACLAENCSICHVCVSTLPAHLSASIAFHPPCADYFKEMQLSLEHLAFLPPNAALALLLAVWPMCRCALQACVALNSWPAPCLLQAMPSFRHLLVGHSRLGAMPMQL